MLKSYKTEINPTLEQIQKINKTIGTCRFVYNFNLARNKEVYEREEIHIRHGLLKMVKQHLFKRKS